MKTNTEKTMIMQMGKEESCVYVAVNGKALEYIKSLRCLGSLITWNRTCTENERCSIIVGKIPLRK